MSGVSIPNLPPATSISGSEEIEIVQNGTSRRATVSQIFGTSVSSIAFGSTGLTPSAATAGAVTVGGVLNVSFGGTGANTAAGARTALGAAASGANTDITSLSPTGGLQVGAPTGGAQGSGTINATGLFVNGVSVGFGSGTVTSVDASGGTTGLTFTGGPITGSGTLTLSGTLAAANGGTGQASYTTGDILYASSSTALSKLSDVATGNALLSGGVGVAPAWGKIGLTTHVTGTLPVANGGTGQTGFTNGQLLIGNTTGNTLTKATLTQGSGISITNGGGSITIANSAPDQTVSLTAGTGISTAGAYPNFTITNTAPDQVVSLTAGTNVTITGTYPNFTIAASGGGGGGSGTVTSVDVSGGTTGLTFSGGPITTSGTITAAGTLGVANGGTGTSTAFTAGSVVFAGASGVYSQDNANLFWDDTNNRLGIGTSSPSAPLEIYGASVALAQVSGDTNAVIRSALYSNNVNPPSVGFRKSRGTLASPAAVSSGDQIGLLNFQAFGGTTNRNLVQIHGIVDTYTSDSNISSYMMFSTSPSGSASATEKMRITAAGDVGIGTSAPNAKLHVEGGSVRTSGSYIVSGAGELKTSLAGSGIALNTTSSNGIAFETGGTPAERMRIDSSGNVGIGTSSPAHKLDVVGSGSVYARARSSDTTGGAIGYVGAEFAGGSALQMRAGAGYTYLVSTGASDPLLFGTNTTERMRIDSSGNVGIGTSSPATKLDVYNAGFAAIQVRSDSSSEAQLRFNTNTAARISNQSNTPLLFDTNAVERMRIDSSGNVGIGTGSPSSKLHVAGALTLDTALTVANGGTGATTLTGLVVGNGTSAFTTVTAPSGAVVGTTDTQTLTNKRVTPRVNAQTTTTSPWAWNSDSYDQQSFSALANALTINADAGTPTDGQKTVLRFKDNGTARALTWTTGSTNSFRAIGVTLPTTTVANKTTYVGCIYNSADSRWDVVAVTTEA